MDNIVNNLEINRYGAEWVSGAAGEGGHCVECVGFFDHFAVHLRLVQNGIMYELWLKIFLIKKLKQRSKFLKKMP